MLINTWCIEGAEQAFESMQARHLMTKTVCSISNQQSLQVAARIMWERDLGWLPVVDGSGRIQAVLTDRDIAMAVYLKHKPLDRIAVIEVQSRDLFACQRDSEMRDVEAIMQRNQVRRLPVINKWGKPIGVISLNDLANTYQCRTNRTGAHRLGLTLAEICRHRNEGGLSNTPSDLDPISKPDVAGDARPASEGVVSADMGGHEQVGQPFVSQPGVI